MVRIIVREPRPGTAAKKPDLLRPGATITVAGLAAEAGAGLAVVRWGGCRVCCRVVAEKSREADEFRRVHKGQQAAAWRARSSPPQGGRAWCPLVSLAPSRHTRARLPCSAESTEHPALPVSCVRPTS